jgi:hypothetical protein
MGRLQDFVTDADLDGKWWWRLRRSFAIPDLASHETAFVAITEEIGQQVHGTPDYLPEVVAEASVVAFLRAGKAGDLEDIFVTNPHAAERVAPSDKAVGPASRITQSARGIGGVRGHLSGDNAILWGNVAEIIVHHFIENIRHLPYEDDAGHYFAG